MEKTNKGCVYFFRHIGLTPIKIGYSENESPMNRFMQFKTYAPYGSEIIGFIQTNEAKLIETKLHLKYVSKRLLGEWFEITEEDVIKEINFYSNIEDVKDRNDFQIAWANELLMRKSMNAADLKLINEISEKNQDKKNRFLKLYKFNKNINKKNTAEALGVSRNVLYNWIKELKP